MPQIGTETGLGRRFGLGRYCHPKGLNFGPLRAVSRGLGFRLCRGLGLTSSAGAAVSPGALDLLAIGAALGAALTIIALITLPL